MTSMRVEPTTPRFEADSFGTLTTFNHLVLAPNDNQQERKGHIESYQLYTLYTWYNYHTPTGIACKHSLKLISHKQFFNYYNTVHGQC